MAEIVGLAASIIQIAGAGAALSTALYNFVGSAVRADQEIADIASDVQVTSNALESVGNVFKTEDAQSIVSKKAILDANNLIKRCENVFRDIELLLDKRRKVGKDGKKTSSVMGKLAWPLKEHRVELHRQRLESLKNSLMVLLHVLQLAQGQARGQLDQSALSAERAKIRELHAQQQDSIRILNLLESKFSNVTISDAGPSLPTIASFSLPPATLSSAHSADADVMTINLSTADDSEVSESESTITDDEEDRLSVEELAKCAQHVQKLLRRITLLQRRCEGTGTRKGHKAKDVHKLYTRFRGRWESEARAPPGALTPLAGQIEATTPVPDVENSSKTPNSPRAPDQSVASTVRALRTWMKPPKYVEEKLEGVPLERQLQILIAILLKNKYSAPGVSSTPVQKSNNPMMAQPGQAAMGPSLPVRVPPAQTSNRAGQQINAQNLVATPQSNASVMVREQQLRNNAVRCAALYIQKNGFPEGANEQTYRQNLVRMIYMKLLQRQAQVDSDRLFQAQSSSLPQGLANLPIQRPQSQQASQRLSSPGLQGVFESAADEALDHCDASDTGREINGLPAASSPFPQSNSNTALQDYQIALMLLEQQNKRRLLFAQQQQSGPVSKSLNMKRASSQDHLDNGTDIANSLVLPAKKKQKTSGAPQQQATAQASTGPSNSHPFVPTRPNPQIRINIERPEEDGPISAIPDLPQVEEYTAARLGAWFEAHAEDPYPDEMTLDALASECDVARSVIEEWFEIRRQQASRNMTDYGESLFNTDDDRPTDVEAMPEILKVEDVDDVNGGNSTRQNEASDQRSYQTPGPPRDIEKEHRMKRQRTCSPIADERQATPNASARSHDEKDIVDILLEQWTVPSKD